MVFFSRNEMKKRQLSYASALIAALLFTSFVACQHDDIADTYQNPDSLALFMAPRHDLKVRGAKGYTISTRLFGEQQFISVIHFSPKHFSLRTILEPQVTRVSETASAHGANFAINACYWNTSTGKAITLIKSGGEILSQTYNSNYPRVNGLLYMYDDHIEINQSYDYPDYAGLIDECDEVIACGPVLLDDGARVSYKYVTESTDESMQEKIPFFINRHPRSVIGRNANGEAFFVVVDGRSAGNAAGMTIDELTQLCAWLGMHEAMNLDGGGSSTLWSVERGVINHPSDNGKFDHEGERQVLSTIIAKMK